MKSKSLFKNKYFNIRPSSLFIGLAVFMFGCYVIRYIRQPEQGDPNSFFDVDIVLEPNPGDDYTDGSLSGFGLFGVLLPEGWVVQDSIEYHYVSEDEKYNADGIILYNAAQASALVDDQPPPDGYYWWGGKTKVELDMHFFDSLYFSPRVLTDEKEGTFKLRYTFGDTENADRVPRRTEIALNDYPIMIGTLTAVEDKIEKIKTKVYPNPAHNQLNIECLYENELPQKVKLLNATGQVMQILSLQPGENQVDISGYPKGMYMLVYEQQDQISTEKIIIE